MSTNDNGSEHSPAAGGRTMTGLYCRSPAGLRLRDKKVERLVRKMRTEMHWVEPSDFPMMRAWAELEVLATRVYAELRDQGVINAGCDTRRLLDDYRKLRATQITLSRELGMSPASRMAFRATGTRTAFDLAAQMAQPDNESEDAIESEPQ
jgi:hypothetical protein